MSDVMSEPEGVMSEIPIEGLALPEALEALKAKFAAMMTWEPCNGVEPEPGGEIFVYFGHQLNEPFWTHLYWRAVPGIWAFCNDDSDDWELGWEGAWYARVTVPADAPPEGER